jgi:hypothetical protein
VADNTSFVIEELTGQKRRVVLNGRALPHRPVKFTGEQKAEFCWYPGNPEASIQVLGAREGATTIKGFWHDRFLGEFTPPNPAPATVSGVPIGTALALAKTVDEIRRSGQLLQVTWDEISRVGILTSFSQEWHRREDVEWEATFTWSVGQGGSVTKTPPVVTQEFDLPNATIGLGQLLAGLKSVVKAFNAFVGQASVIGDFSRDVQAKVASLESGITSMADATDQAVSDVLSPLYTAQRVAGIVGFIRQTAGDMRDSISNSAEEAMVRSPTEMGAAQRTAIRAQQREETNSARDMRNQAANHRANIALQIGDTPEVQDIYEPKQNEDLRAVSTRYYNTPDHWRDLMVFNGLSSSRLTAGMLILIPQLRQGVS